METDAGIRSRYQIRVARVSLVSDAPKPTDLLNEPALVKEMLRAFFATLEPDSEYTVGVYLNARNRLLSVRVCYKGTLDRAMVEPRELLRDALLQGACGLILSHNHPSGDPTPSREDREFTRRLASGCESVGVRLLDHIIVGDPTCASMREMGLL